MAKLSYRFTEQRDRGADQDLWRADRQDGEELATTLCVPEERFVETQLEKLTPPKGLMDIKGQFRSWGRPTDFV